MDRSGSGADTEQARRLSDIANLVRRWVAAGEVDADTATRFLLAREEEARRRRAAWEAAGRPRRRAEDDAAA